MSHVTRNQLHRGRGKDRLGCEPKWLAGVDDSSLPYYRPVQEFITDTLVPQIEGGRLVRQTKHHHNPATHKIKQKRTEYSQYNS